MKTNEMKTYEVPEIDLIQVEINNAILDGSCDAYTVNENPGEECLVFNG